MTGLPRPHEQFVMLQERGRTLYHDQRHHEARAAWQEALRVVAQDNNSNISVLEQQKTRSNLVACLLKLGLAMEAVQEAHRCIELDATWVKAHMRLAEAHKKAGNARGMQIALETVQTLDPAYPGLELFMAGQNNNNNEVQRRVLTRENKIKRFSQSLPWYCLALIVVLVIAIGMGGEQNFPENKYRRPRRMWCGKQKVWITT